MPTHGFTFHSSVMSQKQSMAVKMSTAGSPIARTGSFEAWRMSHAGTLKSIM